ncbi:hypothetical protein HMI54_002750 [Coelomomyces lativittatus]|nr:hypothetical protein HMI54_002750 [Coelomomyces lativittatus]
MTSLQHFILKSEVRSLYRGFLRQIKDTSQEKQEWRTYVRGEFDSCRHYTDLDQVKYALQNGKAQLKRFSSLVILANQK